MSFHRSRRCDGHRTVTLPFSHETTNEAAMRIWAVEGMQPIHRLYEGHFYYASLWRVHARGIDGRVTRLQTDEGSRVRFTRGRESWNSPTSRNLLHHASRPRACMKDTSSIPRAIVACKIIVSRVPMFQSFWYLPQQHYHGAWCATDRLCGVMRHVHHTSSHL